MSVQLTDFPPELLANLFSFLSGHDLCRLSEVCKVFYDATNIERIWRTRCETEFKIKEVDTSVISYRDAYKKLLYRWGHLLGLWQTSLLHYGGLLYIKFTGSKIEGVQYLTPPEPHISRPLRIKPLFTIELSPEDQAVCKCRRGYNQQEHPAQIIKLHHENKEKFKYKCCNPDLHPHPDGRQADFLTWFKEETDNTGLDLEDINGHDFYLMKYMVLLQFDSKMDFCRLRQPASPPDTPLPLRPGLFKGTYGTHGVEIISLTYDLEKHQAEGLKISGDPNVPAGQLSFKVDLQRAMVLSSAQQAAMMTLADIDTPDLQPDLPLDKYPDQPFVVPRDCLDRHGDIPHRCKYRFHGQGQIAGHGFSNATFIPSHWIVFDEDTFGHVWIDLRSISMYSRVQEQFV